jgi:hypothetical protein
MEMSAASSVTAAPQETVKSIMRQNNECTASVKSLHERRAKHVTDLDQILLGPDA